MIFLMFRCFRCLQQIDWHSAAVTEARKKWVTATVETAVGAKKRKLESLGPPTHENRGDKIRRITEQAAAQIRREVQSKEQAAEAKKLELVRPTAVENLRLHVGKGDKAMPSALKEKLAKACKCANGRWMTQRHLHLSPSALERGTKENHPRPSDS